jgi:hypothetical protein
LRILKVDERDPKPPLKRRTTLADDPSNRHGSPIRGSMSAETATPKTEHVDHECPHDRAVARHDD